MNKSPYYENWVKKARMMSEEELLADFQNASEYHQDYIQLVRDRLIREFHYSSTELDKLLQESVERHQIEKVLSETDRPLSLMGKTMVIAGLIFLQWFAACFILIIRMRKRKNSLGEKRYLYDEPSRKWLLNSVFSFVFIWGLVYVMFSFLNRL